MDIKEKTFVVYETKAELLSIISDIAKLNIVTYRYNAENGSKVVMGLNTVSMNVGDMLNLSVVTKLAYHEGYEPEFEALYAYTGD